MTEPLFNFRLNEEKKAKWQEYVDNDDELNSIAQLIRKSVSAEINDSTDSVEQSPGILTDIHKLQDELERVRKDVRWLRNQQQDTVDISGLAQRVLEELEELPKFSVDIPDDVEDEETYRRQAWASQALTPSGPDDQAPSYTVQSIANRLDVEPSDVREAIEHLENQFLPITSVELEGEIHYFLKGS